MHKRSGHLWQGRFYSCALDDKGFWLATKYVELNPVRAKVCRLPWQYEWSSAGAHTDSKIRSNLPNWHKMISEKEWRSELANGIDEAQIGRIRLSTHTGALWRRIWTCWLCKTSCCSRANSHRQNSIRSMNIWLNFSWIRVKGRYCVIG